MGVIFPREADGSGMLLVHPGFSGGELVRLFSFGFLVPAILGNSELPWGSDLFFPRKVIIGLS